MRQKIIILLISLAPMIGVRAQDCDNVTLPYTVDFTQCWTAEGGAEIIDPNHAAITNQGQTLIGPWIESEPGNTFLSLGFSRDGDGSESDYDLFTIYVENMSGEVIWDVLLRPVNYGISYTFTSPGGPLRLGFYYEGTDPVPSFRITGIHIFQYEIEATLEAPRIAHVGDTVTYVLHANLQEGDTLDEYYWETYDPAGNYIALNWYNSGWYNTENVNLISLSDSIFKFVPNTTGTYEIDGSAIKYLQDNYNYRASASTYQLINVVDYEFYSEDSIYYKSSAKDTVIGCHPQLHRAILPESVRVIDYRAFQNLDNLSAVSLPDGLRYIGIRAFADNQRLTEVTIPQDVKNIGEFAFGWCYGLTTVNFNATNCTKMGYSINPSTGAATGNEVFYNCQLTTINIGENVKRIPDYAFAYSYYLKGSLVFPDKVTYIGTYAFYGRRTSESMGADDTLRLCFGSRVSEIGNYAFQMPNGKLQAVVSRNPVPPTIYLYTFVPSDTTTLTVPCGSSEAYRTSDYWDEFVLIDEDCGGGSEGIDETDSGDVHVHIYSRNGQIVVEGTDDEIRVFDMTGRLVAISQSNRVNVSASGVYLVKVGERSAQKVTVVR